MFLYVCHFHWRLLMAQSQRSESGVPRMGGAVRAVRRARLSALRVPERQACSWCPEFSCHPLPLGKEHASLTPGVWTKRILLLLLVCNPRPLACASLLVRPPDLKGQCPSFVWALSRILYSTKCLHQDFVKHWKVNTAPISGNHSEFLEGILNHQTCSKITGWCGLVTGLLEGSVASVFDELLTGMLRMCWFIDSLFARFSLNPLVAC